MKYKIIVIRSLKVAGMAVYPFILINDPKLRNDTVLIRHEIIHLRQQLELLILPFYVLYAVNYLINRIKYKNHDEAYLHVIFEKEAYANELDATYLQKRKAWAWRLYV